MQERNFFFVLAFLGISPRRISKSNYCQLHNFLMVWNILIIFSRDIGKDHSCVAYKRSNTDFDFLRYVGISSKAESLCSSFEII